MDQSSMLQMNKEGWNKVAHHFLEDIKETLSYGPYVPTEEELNLLGDISGSVTLEVGCGSGHTLEYLSRHGAKEQWGVDMSPTQIETAKKTVSSVTIPITFIESPMEEITDLPPDYFDKAISIYALGWTVNLRKTLQNIHRALK